MTSLRAFFVMVGLMFLSFPAAAEVCEESAQKTLPVFSESEKQARNKYLKETKAFMEKLEVPSGLKVAVVVVGCLPDNSLTGSILKVVLVLNKDGTESSDKSEPLMSFDYQVIIYVTPPVFKNDVTAVTWLAAHEICHVKQETSEGFDVALYVSSSLKEELAERCVTYLIGAEAHAVAMLNNLKNNPEYKDMDHNELYDSLFADIAYRMKIIPDPFATIRKEDWRTSARL